MRSLPTPQKIVLSLFTVLLCFTFAQVFWAQVFGLLGLYRLWIVLPATLLLTIGAASLYFRWGSQAFFTSFPPEAPFPRWLDWTLYAVGAALVLLLVVAPAAGWPYSPVSETLNQDAGAYHLPKAVELYRSGNVWDLSIPYGEYPFGYESMLSFGMLLAGGPSFFGAVHALTDLLALLSIWLLARRFTRIPGGLLFSLCAVGFLSALVTIQYNPFYIFMDQAFVIGKNDMFLGMGVLAVAAHSPVGRRGGSPAHIPGIAYATLLVLATKPSGMFAAAPLWLLAGWDWLRAWRAERRAPWKELAFSAAVIVPGGLWALRNLFIIHAVFPEGVWVMNGWSIANNLANRFFYAYLPRNFTFLLALLALAAIFCLWKRLVSGRILLAFVVLFAAFAFTPESAFQKTTQEPTRIAWRLGVALVGFEWAVLLALLDPLIVRAVGWLNRVRALQAALALAALAGGAWLVRANPGLLSFSPANAIVLRDEFRDPVGTEGFYSAYDFVQKTIRGKVIEVGSGVFYYMYGPGYTNSPTKLQYPLGRENMVPQLDPDYFVVIQYTSPFKPSAQFLARWKLVYADPHGQVFARIR